jgi:NAD(P)-dependent dehydrogenase (short-subunit alcohol dehydrogenase family)
MTTLTQIPSSSVFLVSGGARGVTAQCVIRLAQSNPCTFILLGRSPLATSEPSWAKGCIDEAELKKNAMQALIAQGDKPTPIAVNKLCQQILSQRQIQETLNAITATGSRVEYLPVDVTSAETLKGAIAAVESRVGQVTGIIHGAGNLADKWIEQKTEKDFENVYSAKVRGLENLLHSVPADRLKHLVLFSSVAGFYGNSGQSDYALANEILNKSAHLIKRNHPNCHVVSVNWGPWDSGMVTPELKKIFKQRKINVIPLEVGAQMLVDELSHQNHKVSQVVIGSAITPSAVATSEDLKRYRVRRRLTLESNPFLQDYCPHETPTLSPMVAASWLTQVCEQRYPGYRFVRLENFKVLDAIAFNDLQPQDFLVDVKETAKPSSGEIEFEVVISAEVQGQTKRFYQGEVAIAPTLTADQELKVVPFNSTHAPAPAASLYEKGILFQGTSFQGIESVAHVSSTKVALNCVAPKLDDVMQGQFPVQSCSGFALDTICQAIALWGQQEKRSRFTLTEFQRLEQFKKLECGQRYFLLAEFAVQNAANVTANITIHDQDGEAYLKVRVTAEQPVQQMAYR